MKSDKAKQLLSMYGHNFMPEASREAIFLDAAKKLLQDLERLPAVEYGFTIKRGPRADEEVLISHANKQGSVQVTLKNRKLLLARVFDVPKNVPIHSTEVYLEYHPNLGLLGSHEDVRGALQDPIDVIIEVALKMLERD